MKKQLLTMLISAITITAFSQNENQSLVCSTNIVADSSFEAGSPNGNWTESSTNFGSPLCTTSLCGFGNGTGPNTGSWWAWFGGITAEEEGSVSQSIELPANSTANLNFYLEIPSCAPGGFVDFMAVIVDGTDTLFKVTDASILCGVQAYTLQTVNLDTYSDGSEHNITFYGHTISNTNFFVDDISVIACPLTTGIQNMDPALYIDISPNPVKDKLKISFRQLPVNEVKIEINNLMGQSLYQHTALQGSMDHDDFYIQIAGLLEPGIYFVNISSGQKMFTQKLIVR